MFRPARNRNSPGDPPPKWATIGRAGRLALVITVIVGVVIALVIIGARSADATDAVASPTIARESPPPWFGGRVEMPEHGFAVTVPDGWIAFDLEGDVVAQVEAVQAHAAETPTESLDRLRSTLLAVSAVGGPLLALELSDIVKQSCSFQVPWGGAPLDDALAEVMYEDMVAHDSSAEVMPPRPVTIEGGHGWLLASSHQNSYYADEQGWLAMYRLTTDGGQIAVSCSADERPTDDWLSVVETLEILPSNE